MFVLKKQRGFTIVELLVVIVVIGILATITIVAYTGIQAKARDAALTSDLTNSGKTVTLWMIGSRGSIATLLTYYATYGGGYSAWIVGDGADNALTNQLKWNDVPELPKISPSKGSTLEIIGRYAGAPGWSPNVINERMRTKNVFCIAGAAPGSSYSYRPMSAIHKDYDKMLYFDSAYGKVMTIQELTKLYDAGREVTCEGHVTRWKEANS